MTVSSSPTTKKQRILAEKTSESAAFQSQVMSESFSLALLFIASMIP
jgi:hypothetical protein